MKLTTVNNHTDSIWLKLEELDQELKEFFQPEIDSTNLIALFTEKKFLDRSIDAYTFTYEPKTTLPDSMKLQHWDVYIDPESGKVKRIYLVKFHDKKTWQLTWQSNKWCKINTISEKPDGNSVLEKEEKITWDY